MPVLPPSDPDVHIRYDQLSPASVGFATALAGLSVPSRFEAAVQECDKLFGDMRGDKSGVTFPLDVSEPQLATLGSQINHLALTQALKDQEPLHGKPEPNALFWLGHKLLSNAIMPPGFHSIMGRLRTIEPQAPIHSRLVRLSLWLGFAAISKG